MSLATKEQNWPNRRFTLALVGIVLCAQIVGCLVAIYRSKLIVAGALLVLAGLRVMVLRGLVRSHPG